MSLNLQDMIAELSAGEEARKRIPEFEQRLAEANRQVTSLSEHNQALELKARDREDQISTLMGKIRDLTKDRDDALLAEMEADEKLKSFRGTVEKFSSAVAAALSGVGAANALLDPPKPVLPAPEPVKEPETAPQANNSANSPADTAAPSQGQSEPGRPTANTQSAEQSQTVESSGVESTGSVGTGNTTDLSPRDESEANRKSRGLDWYDKNGVNHSPISH